VVACLTNPGQRSDLSDRERLALEFLDLLATDHHSIGDDLYRRVASSVVCHALRETVEC